MRKSTGELQGFEAKDRVWSIRYGWGTVVSVGLIGHGLRVKFDNIKHNDPIFGVFFFTKTEK